MNILYIYLKFSRNTLNKKFEMTLSWKIENNNTLLLFYEKKMQKNVVAPKNHVIKLWWRWRWEAVYQYIFKAHENACSIKLNANDITWNFVSIQNKVIQVSFYTTAYIILCLKVWQLIRLFWKWHNIQWLLINEAK